MFTRTIPFPNGERLELTYNVFGQLVNKVKYDRWGNVKKHRHVECRTGEVYIRPAATVDPLTAAGAFFGAALGSSLFRR